MKKRAKKSFLDPLRAGGSSCALVNGRNHRVIAHTVMPAFDSASRRRGLLHHDSLPEDSALIIAPSNAIHTVLPLCDRRGVRLQGRTRAHAPGPAVLAHRGGPACLCGHPSCPWAR
jgi:hypothetical protein